METEKPAGSQKQAGRDGCGNREEGGAVGHSLELDSLTWQCSVCRVANTHPSPSPASAPRAAKSPGELAAPAPSASSHPPSLSHPAVPPPPPLLRKGSLEGHQGPPLASSS